MAIDRTAEAALALHRFGFGPTSDSIAAIASDPHGAVLAELEQPGAGSISVALPSSAEAARAVYEFRAEERAKQKLAERAKREAEAKGEPAAMADASLGAPSAPNAMAKPGPSLPAELLQNEAKVRFEAAVAAPIGLVERLVWFWSNHFCVSADKIAAMAGPYEREAIRPHVLGRFADMLQAVESHPAMLFYLDNIRSMGVESVAGINRDKGINENLAREILELHTLGARSGYAQQDVTNFANVLTGWSWVPLDEPEHGGEFVFIKRLHQPGDQPVLGKRYPDTGLGQGRAVLSDLARHPATAQHVAQKIAAHFVADEPPRTLVARLAKAFKDSDGNLKEVARALVTAEESWTPQRTKLKRPAEWIVGVLRLTGASCPIPRLSAAQTALGEPLWRPPAPNGFPDNEAAWIDGVPRRLAFVNELAARLPQIGEPAALLASALGPLASAETRETIARAESRTQAVALLTMTPEFLRR